MAAAGVRRAGIGFVFHARIDGALRLSSPFMMHRLLVSVVGAGLLLGLGGCVERYSIRPTQLGELNDDLATNTGTRLTIKLETVHGRIIEVTPPVIVYITTSDGQEHMFCSPLRANFANDGVELKHNCGRSARFTRSEISKVEVEN